MSARFLQASSALRLAKPKQNLIERHCLATSYTAQQGGSFWKNVSENVSELYRAAHSLCFMDPWTRIKSFFRPFPMFFGWTRTWCLNFFNTFIFLYFASHIYKLWISSFQWSHFDSVNSAILDQDAPMWHWQCQHLITRLARAPGYKYTSILYLRKRYKHGFFGFLYQKFGILKRVWLLWEFGQVIRDSCMRILI